MTRGESAGGENCEETWAEGRKITRGKNKRNIGRNG